MLGTRHAKPIRLKIPVTIAGMSFGALSGPAKEALGRGATLAGTSTTTGDGGMTDEERGHSQTLVYQYLPSRYGMNPRDLRQADAIEIVVGQGASPAAAACSWARRSPTVSPRCAPCPRASTSARPAAIGLDRAGRSGDQDPRIARDHRLGEADLRQGRRGAALLRHGPCREGRGRRGGAGWHAGRHGGDADVFIENVGMPTLALHPPGRAGAAGSGHAPQGVSSSSRAASARVRTWPRRWR
ncbi:MAG: glutamate synthase-related protein [Geminicoccaceae bacterium]